VANLTNTAHFPEVGSGGRELEARGGSGGHERRDGDEHLDFDHARQLRRDVGRRVEPPRHLGCVGDHDFHFLLDLALQKRDPLSKWFLQEGLALSCRNRPPTWQAGGHELFCLSRNRNLPSEELAEYSRRGTSMPQQRRHYSPEQKVALLRLHLLEKKPVFD